MISTDDPRHIICPMRNSGDDVVCYFNRPRANCYVSSGGSPFNSIDHGYPCERLRVKEGCTSFWIPYIARDPRPPRAVIAGHMVSGDRVYVTKFDYYHPPALSLSGHYVEGAENTITAFWRGCPILQRYDDDGCKPPSDGASDFRPRAL